MADKRPVPPFNWKRSLLVLGVMDVVFLAIALVGKMTSHAGVMELGVGGLAVGLIGTIAIGIFGPVFTRQNQN